LPASWFVVALSALTLAGAASGANGRPDIKTAEVGYFGGAVVTHQFSVFVYSDLGPSSGNRVTVCAAGLCKRARGHNARLAWYSASFTSAAGLRMSDAVHYTVTARDAAGQSKRTFTSDLLCMHNNGSTPQT
jgi:hypothetical protein